MGNFVEFIKEINQKIGISLPASWTNLSEVCLAQRFLEKLNEYFFQTYEKIGTGLPPLNQTHKSVLFL